MDAKQLCIVLLELLSMVHRSHEVNRMLTSKSDYDSDAYSSVEALLEAMRGRLIDGLHDREAHGVSLSPKQVMALFCGIARKALEVNLAASAPRGTAAYFVQHRLTATFVAMEKRLLDGQFDRTIGLIESIAVDAHARSGQVLKLAV